MEVLYRKQIIDNINEVYEEDKANLKTMYEIMRMAPPKATRPSLTPFIKASYRNILTQIPDDIDASQFEERVSDYKYPTIENYKAFVRELRLFLASSAVEHMEGTTQDTALSLNKESIRSYAFFA